MKIKLRLSFALYVLAIIIIDGAAAAICLCISLFLHECAHVIMGFVFHERFEQIELTPFGGILTRRQRHGARRIKGTLIAASGPLSNYALILLVSQQFARQLLPDEIIRKILIINLSMIIINLIPAIPLDGGRIVFCLGEYVFPIAPLVHVLSVTGVMCGVGFLCTSIFGLLEIGTLNLSMALCGIYMIRCTPGQCRLLLTENLYEFLTQRQTAAAAPLHTAVYWVYDHAPLYTLISALCRSRHCAFLISSGDKPRILDESDIIQALLETPQASIGQLFSDHGGPS